MCRSYNDLNFCVTFLEHSVHRPKLIHPAVRSLCGSWAACHLYLSVIKSSSRLGTRGLTKQQFGNYLLPRSSAKWNIWSQSPRPTMSQSFPFFCFPRGLSKRTISSSSVALQSTGDDNTCNVRQLQVGLFRAALQFVCWLNMTRWASTPWRRNVGWLYNSIVLSYVVHFELYWQSYIFTNLAVEVLKPRRSTNSYFCEQSILPFLFLCIQ